MSIKFENTVTPSPEQWKAAIMGARNAMNSWDRSDSEIKYESLHDMSGGEFVIGQNDLDLMKRLVKAGTDHRKFMRMLPVTVTITAPLYWWKEFSTYKVGTVANSCSTMHKIHAKEFTLDDFSCEHLITDEPIPTRVYSSLEMMEATVENLNLFRELYLKTKDKKYWWQMIQHLPSSYNQKRTVMMNYEVLANIYKSRKNHKLDEWSENVIMVDSEEISNNWLPNGEINKGFCDWIKSLPYSELITGDSNV